MELDKYFDILTILENIKNIKNGGNFQMPDWKKK